MDKKIKISAVVAALLAVSPVASSVVSDAGAPSVAQAASKKSHKKAKKSSKKPSKKTKKRSKKIAGYSITAYKKADAFIPRRNIKLKATDDYTDEKLSQTLKKGVMYNVAPIRGYGEQHFWNSYYFLDTEVKGKDVIPFNHNTDKTIKKYVTTFNSFLKKLNSNESVGLKFKKDTTILMSPPHVNDISDKDTIVEETGKVSKLRKHAVKKNQIVYIDNNKLDKEDFIKQNGKYYFFVNTYISEYNNDPYADQWAYIPADSVTFTKLEGSSDYLKSNYSL